VSALEVCALATSHGVSAHNSRQKPDIAGTTPSADRDPKGRHPPFEEIGGLIEACRRPHTRDLFLWDLGVTDFPGYGSTDTNKRRPIVPISDPVGRIPMRPIAAHGNVFPIQAVVEPLVVGARNRTQVIQRIVKRAGIDEKRKPGQAATNRVSIRRTFADFLDEHASDADLSAVSGTLTSPGRPDASSSSPRAQPQVSTSAENSNPCCASVRDLTENGGRGYSLSRASTFDPTAKD
jgi:hypothetical protein